MCVYYVYIGTYVKITLDFLLFICLFINIALQPHKKKQQQRMTWPQ